MVDHVKDFFQSGEFPQGLNDTNVVLIPKKKVHETMGDLQPISLSNVASRVISKILANRLKWVLPYFISDEQSVCIPGRLISDNILVVFEVMHYLKRKRQGKV